MRYVYRIMYTEWRDDPKDDYNSPYELERRPWFWPFWEHMNFCKNIEECEKKIREHKLKTKPRRLVCRVGGVFERTKT